MAPRSGSFRISPSFSLPAFCQGVRLFFFPQHHESGRLFLHFPSVLGPSPFRCLTTLCSHSCWSELFVLLSAPFFCCAAATFGCSPSSPVLSPSLDSFLLLCSFNPRFCSAWVALPVPVRFLEHPRVFFPFPFFPSPTPNWAASTSNFFYVTQPFSLCPSPASVFFSDTGAFSWSSIGQCFFFASLPTLKYQVVYVGLPSRPPVLWGGFGDGPLAPFALSFFSAFPSSVTARPALRLFPAFPFLFLSGLCSQFL